MSALLPGFAEPVFDSQSTFRAVMEAFARPGSLQSLPVRLGADLPVPEEAAAVLLALADGDTPVFLGGSFASAAAAEFLLFHAQARVIDRPEGALFALVEATDFVALRDRFEAGSAEYPDRSATIIIPVDDFDSGPVLRLQGPGIRREALIQPSILPGGFVGALAANRARFSMGVDLLLVSGRRIMGLPRSTRMEPV